VDFGKVRVKKNLSKRVILKNYGKIDATARIELVGNANFGIKCENTAPVLKPGDTIEFEVKFHPRANGAFTHELNIKTLLNPFENIVIDLKGEAFEDDILFDDLPFASEDTLTFGDTWVNHERIQPFTMVNNSKNWIRFTWPNRDSNTAHEALTFTPSVGFIAPNSTKQIAVRFFSEKPLNLSNPLTLTTVGLANVQEDWDNSMIDMRFICKSE